MIEAKNGKKNESEHIIGILVDDHPGVMSKLCGLFARRGFNINSIIVGKTDKPGLTHIVISLVADNRTIEQVEKQINKLIDVVKITDLSPQHSVVREHCLVRVSSTESSRDAIVNLAKLKDAKVLNVNHTSIILELVDSPQKIDNFLEMLAKYGVKELSRTGINAMQNGN
ncbi:MAG: acetolactate synthase small subunit [archaeon]|jgi:acetolactate synthase-1/3 small subunit|nr:acetolactate synthase small subunit [archaeon]